MKVGDYVHYHYTNYLSYGLSVNQRETVNPLNVFKTQRELMKSSLPSRDQPQKLKIKQDLEKSLNFYYGLRSGNIDFNFSDAEAKALSEVIVEIALKAAKELKVKIPGELNLDNLDAQMGESINTGEYSGEITKVRKAADFNTKGQTKTTYQALYRRLKILLDLKNSIGASLTTNTPDANFYNRVQSLENEYSLFVREIQNMGSSGLSTVYFDAFKGEGDSARSYGQFAKEIQNLLNMAKTTTATALKGYMAETIPIITQYVYKQFLAGNTQNLLAYLKSRAGQNQMIDLIKTNRPADDKSIKATLASKVLNKKTSSNNIQAQIQGLKINEMLTQDKVDIIVDVPNYGSLNASVKNINLKSGFNIGILKGANLINYIQDYPQFANHYLNITSNLFRKGRQPSSSLIKDANQTLKLTIALHSLSGGLWGLSNKTAHSAFKSPQAELFIVNDSSGNLGHYSVYFISDLLHKIAENINLLQIDEITLSKQFENKWIGTTEGKNLTYAYARISSILAQLRTQKLTVSISPAILI